MELRVHTGESPWGSMRFWEADNNSQGPGGRELSVEAELPLQLIDGSQNTVSDGRITRVVSRKTLNRSSQESKRASTGARVVHATTGVRRS